MVETGDKPIIATGGCPRRSEEPTPQSALWTALRERRERVFLLFAGVFIGSMTMLNILGITRFVHIGPLALAVGVLPYPLTFLCTDFISEFYGRRRANFVVHETRVGQRTDFDSLTLSVETNGAIDPEEAIRRASVRGVHQGPRGISRL